MFHTAAGNTKKNVFLVLFCKLGHYLYIALKFFSRWEWPWCKHPKRHFRMQDSHWITKMVTIKCFSFHCQVFCQVWNITSGTAGPSCLGKWHSVTRNRKAASSPSNVFWERAITLKTVFKWWWKLKEFYSVSCFITKKVISGPPFPLLPYNMQITFPTYCWEIKSSVREFLPPTAPTA